MRSEEEIKDRMARLHSDLARAHGTRTVVLSARLDILRWVLELPDPFDAEDPK